MKERHEDRTTTYESMPLQLHQRQGICTQLQWMTKKQWAVSWKPM